MDNFEDYYEKKNRLDDNCDFFKTAYSKGHLQSIKPHWHPNWKSIDKDEMIDANIIKPEPIDQDIYVQVPLKPLMLSIESHLNIIISEKVLFHSLNRYPIARYIFDDEKTCQILTHWKAKKPLLPPQIHFQGKQMTLVNGTHRLNAAFCLGAKTIPVMLEKYQSDKLIRNKYMHLFKKLLS